MTTITSIVGLALGLTLMLLSVMAMRGAEGPVPGLSVPLFWSGPIDSIVLTPSDEEMTTATEKAVDAWNEYEGRAVFAIGEAGIPISWSSNLTMNGVPIAAGWYAEQRRIEIDVSYRPGIDCLRCAIAHELGHVLGIDHGDGPFGLTEGPSEESVYAGPPVPSVSPVVGEAWCEAPGRQLCEEVVP